MEDRNKILEELPSESFGGGIKKSLNPYKTSRIFLKGVDTCIKEERIESTLKSISSDILAVKRLKNNLTLKFRQVVKVSCTQEAALKLFGSNLQIGGKEIKIERQRGYQVIRCFSCQAYGHIAENCKREAACENCSEQSCHKPCTNLAKCANCGGNHPASDIKCPVFIDKHEDIAKQYPINKYIESLVKPSSSEAPAPCDSSTRDLVSR